VDELKVILVEGERSRPLEGPIVLVESSDEGVCLHFEGGTQETVAAQIASVDLVQGEVVLKSHSLPPVLQWIMRRRSIRKYTHEPVSDEQIQFLLQAAMAAPSANDVRPWSFVVVRDAQKRRALAAIKEWAFMCAQAPVVFAVLGNPDLSDHWVEDCSAAAENLLLAAPGLGLGGVWVAIYPRTAYEKQVRTLLNIPANWRVLCLLAVGHPAETKPARTRYEANKVYFETFGG
jgi:nitroreductase